MKQRTTGHRAVELRPAEDHDARALARLAARDTRALPPGPHLVAVREGRIDAALSVATGESVADPFRRTAELVELLRCHARAMTAASTGYATPRTRRGVHARPVTA